MFDCFFSDSFFLLQDELKDGEEVDGEREDNKVCPGSSPPGSKNPRAPANLSFSRRRSPSASEGPSTGRKGILTKGAMPWGPGRSEAREEVSEGRRVGRVLRSAGSGRSGLRGRSEY